MRKQATRCVWIVLLLATAVFAQDGSQATTTKQKKDRPTEAKLYEHIEKPFANPKDDPSLPRVLLIGDSISIGYTVPVRNYLKGKANVHRPRRNCRHTAYGMKHLKNWLGSGKWDVIHFNWGIWDIQYFDKKTGELLRGPKTTTVSDKARLRHSPEEYRANLTKLVAVLKTTNARLIWASSTPVMAHKGERFRHLEEHNRVAESVMKGQGVEIDDLYQFTLPHAKEWQTKDQCHFNPTGNKALGKKVGDAILKAINSPAMPNVTRGEESVVEGRKVVRFEHESLQTWGYAKPQKDYFYVVYPKAPTKSRTPLRVYLHSAGGSGESELPFEIRRMKGNDTFYGLCLDCRGNQANDWWWGYDSIKKTPEQFKGKIYPTEKRVLATIAWAVKKYHINPNRIYLNGISMGGSGSLGIGLRRGDLFAAISVTVPAGADHALFRMDGSQYPDPPPLFDFSSQNDKWSKGQSNLLDYCKKQRYALAFAWGPLGHINDRTKFNPMVAEFPWLSIRKNEAYPAFTNASSDDVYPGFKNTTSPDQIGQINGCFRWKNLTDTTDQFIMELRLVRKEELKKPVETPTQSITDVTLRRLQNFLVKPGETYRWQMAQNDQVVQSGKVQADAKGVLTIPKVKISATPTQLKIIPRQKDPE